ncbi:FUSC family protein [Actinomadura roseirufa]|uniref:FUSC family protein n=1 Tax=Actinomadura roseirufa TaxID=2094049 RepID=UPI0010411F51|nr:FUSC family protein [Actinomadura roseirufa]
MSADTTASGKRTGAYSTAALTMAAVLAAYGSTLYLQRSAHLNADVLIQSVVLSVSLARTERNAALPDRFICFAALPAVAIVSAGLGDAMSSEAFLGKFLGDAAFTLLVTSAIWVRRFGARAARTGQLALLPAIALLAVPRIPGHDVNSVLWAPIVALIACFWVTAFQLLVGARDAPRQGPLPTAAKGRIAPSTRMAAQTGAALSTAFALGHLFFPDHWAWVVLTTFIVCQGARGRGDALHKGVLRALGAAGGTLVAALAAGAYPPGDQDAVVLIFIVLGIAVWLRHWSYAYWAGGVTAALSLLYGYFGQAAEPLLRTRLEAIMAGAVIGVAAAWLILPFRTRDVLRRRTAEALAALTDVLAGEADASRRFERAVAELDLLHGPLTMHRLVSRRTPHHVDAIDALRASVRSVQGLAPDARLGELRRNVGAVRLALAGRADGAYRRVPADGAPAATAVAEIDGQLARLHEIFAPPTPRKGSPESVRPDG